MIGVLVALYPIKRNMIGCQQLWIQYGLMWLALMDPISNKVKYEHLPVTLKDLVHKSHSQRAWHCCNSRQKGKLEDFPAGISQTASARCQQQQFRRLSPHPCASQPESLSVFSLHYSQLLLLWCALFTVRRASTVGFVLLCEGLCIKTTVGKINGPAGGTQKEL